LAPCAPSKSLYDTRAFPVVVEMTVCPLDFRYGRAQMLDIFSEETRLQRILDVEAALARAHADMGTIPMELSQEISEKATTTLVTTERVKEIESRTRHDIMAIVHALGEQCSQEAAKYIHLGATSYDIVDTAVALQMKDALKLLDSCLADLESVLAHSASKYRDTPMLGRTHGQFAVPITFGLKLAVFAAEVHRHRGRLARSKEGVLVGKMSGATGTGAGFGKGALEVQDRVMEGLGLGFEEGSTQIVQRDRHIELMCTLANIAVSCEKFATEIRNLGRSEIGEVAEHFDESSQVGSSTMAHKRNPVLAENICGLARVMRGFVNPTFEAAIQWHERDLANSSVERFSIPHSFVLIDDILAKSVDLFSGLGVFPKRMMANLDSSKGIIMAESVMLALAGKGMDRQVAHELLRKCSMEALSKEAHLYDVLKEESKVTSLLSTEELEEAMDPLNYTGSAGEIIDRIVETIEKGS